MWGGFSLTANDLTIQKVDSLDNRLEFSGGLVLKDVFSASITLGQDGMYYEDGKLHLDSLALSVTDVNLGAFTLSKVQVTITDTAGQVDVDSYIEMTFPQGWLGSRGD